MALTKEIGGAPRLTHTPPNAEISVAPSGPKARSVAGMFVTDILQASAVLHHARGSFTAVAEIMVEGSPCPPVRSKPTAIFRTRSSADLSDFRLGSVLAMACGQRH